ncbi:uncharacterized protein LOC122665438 [Telopea speciosissima]|uniref:uncharacterized protein LOC122665438 n=1 Tax=Telopea speciosissima TaxID=54955 RepID=UPI001CC58837|nr:uncharacterized protein LOC122665438 [Telopea speciosissima]
MSLSQGSKSVLEYQQIFEEYFYFALTHLKIEEVKARRFERGLRANLSTSVVLHKYPTYAEVVQAAKLIEDQQRENYRAIQASKMPMPSHDSRGPNKFQRREAYTNVAPIQSRRPDVAQVPKSTSAPYYGPQTLVCYNCKESGYMVKDCPQPRRPGSWPAVTPKAPLAKTAVRPLISPPASKTHGRVYSITYEEAQSDPGVIIGMISVCSLPAYVLFDSGTSHSFISPSFAEKLSIELASMEQKLIVYTPTGSKVELDQAFNSCPARVSDHGLEASLIILDMRDFDIILGMDSSSTHGASLICAERKILFKSEEGNEFVFKGNKSKKPRKTIILGLQVQKLLAQGCQCYLASMLDTEAKITPMEEISQVAFLGHLVSAKGIEVDPGKVQSVVDWETPKSVTDIHSFLGLASYYRRFIENFLKISAPMTRLSRNGVKFKWSDDYERNFQDLKQRLISALVLTIPNGTEGIVVYCDAPKMGLSCVLMQNEKVVAHASFQLKDYERNYPTHDLELAAVVKYGDGRGVRDDEDDSDDDLEFMGSGPSAARTSGAPGGGGDILMAIRRLNLRVVDGFDEVKKQLSN